MREKPTFKFKWFSADGKEEAPPPEDIEVLPVLFDGETPEGKRVVQYGKPMVEDMFDSVVKDNESLSGEDYEQ